MGPRLALMSSQGFPASVRRQPTPAQARTREDGLHPRWGWLRRGSDYYRRRAPANRCASPTGHSSLLRRRRRPALRPLQAAAVP